MSPDPADGSPYRVLAEIPDPRHRRGTVYPLAAVLTLVAAATLCGCRSLAAIARWGRDDNHLAPLLGFSRTANDRAGYRTPCTGGLHTLLAALPAAAFEAALTRWVLAQGVADLDRRVVAIDGKTPRGSRGHQLPGVHLLAASCRDVEAVVARLAVPGKTDEHKTGLELLKLIPLKGTPVTGDAALTQRDFCEAVVREGITSSRSRTTSRRRGRTSGRRSARLFPPGRRRGGPPRTTGPRPTARATVGLRPAGSGPPRGRRGTSTGRGEAGVPAGAGAAGQGRGDHRDGLRGHRPRPRAGLGGATAGDRGGTGGSRTVRTGSVT